MTSRPGILLLFVLPILFLTKLSVAQKKIKSIAVNDEIVYATVDRPGDLYILTKGGQIQKFDKDGMLQSVYKNNPTPTLFDPRDGSRLFAYFKSDQHYAFLNPSFETTKSNKIDSSFALDPWLACVSGDYNLWILDAADVSLKKVNVTTGTVDVDVKFSQNANESSTSYVSMREYQGFLFLLHKEKGIQIFGGLGKLLKTINPGAISYFNFLGEELYFPTTGGLKFFNLFTAETREMPLKQTGKFILITDERLFILQNNSIDFFESNP